MTISNGYCTLNDFDSHARILDPVDNPEKERAIEAASRWIDSYCDRHFWQAVGATRTFAAGDPYCVEIDDLVSLTTLKTDATGDGTFEVTWSAADYQLLPVNPAAAPEQEPYDTVRAVGSLTFPAGRSWGARDDRVQIVGTFGWPAIPTAVRQACLIQAVRLLGRRYSPQGVVVGQGDFVFRVSRNVDPDVADLLAPYRLHPVLVA